MLSILFILTALASPVSTNQNDADSAAMVAVTLATVKKLQDDLKDSSSAKFRNVHLTTITAKDGRLHHAVCGEVNSKNSFGGYVGWTLFFSGYSNDGSLKLYFDSERKGLIATAICYEKYRVWHRNTDISSDLQRLVTAP